MESTTVTALVGAPEPAPAEVAEPLAGVGLAPRAGQMIPNLTAVSRLLEREPGAFEFFQAVRLLERMYPERAPIGHFGDPQAEAVQFSATPATAFPPSEIHSLEMPDAAPGRMMVNFLGLTGPLGVLPYHYTLLIAERRRAKDTAIGAFFDLFNHRFVSLLYRAWQKHCFAAVYEKHATDLVTEHFLDLVGLGLASQRGHLPIPDAALGFYAGLLGPQQRGAVALEQLIEEFFGVPVEIEQFVGGWHTLPADDQCAVGEESLGMATQLGYGVVVGDEVWDQQTRVRIQLGPLGKDEYDRFLPSGDAYRTLGALARFFAHDQFEFELRLVLAKDDVPGFVVGAEAAASQPLGWSTWIRTRSFERDADETVLTL
jgi:type VI secretion system protein ImpH